MYSLRFPDNCIFHDNIEKYFIEMNQQIIVEPLFWLEIEEEMVPINCTSHAEWESCKNVKQHAKYGDYGPHSFEELYLYDNETNEKISDDKWYMYNITFGNNKIKYLYGSSKK